MKRFTATILAVLMGFGILSPAALARANEKGAHNLAIGSTAAAAYLLSHKDTRGLGVVAAGGAAYAWKKHHDAVKQRHDRARYRYSRASRRARAVRNSRANSRARANRVSRASQRALTVRNSHAQ
ncbi:MAG TPA: hypothetical protein VGM51_15700 [Armatimonadota bacterium]|jgi:hypothetical protein